MVLTFEVRDYLPKTTLLQRMRCMFNGSEYHSSAALKRYVLDNCFCILNPSFAKGSG